ncbi:bifunctional folylpolyglutamate synthase/dihydrofolate synthase [Robiginitalea sp. IMCC44478]|uniref:bifunctional folylpolyglutamate synthase/dihydrofolate synthase n=1 Tax=Robiginitalea sp. IMCC44478 TaxID=3459122 RepID=UPI004041090D
MTYRQTLDWMFAQLPMYQQKGAVAYNAKLDNIKALDERLNHPHHHFKSIHVTGTNGKGSSSHMQASVLQEAGYRVGLYTSPHLKDFRERIRINGIPVSKQFVIGFIGRHRRFLEQHKLSFFEMTVGMAFEYFRRKKVDIAIIEVGLGGRLDSTNIIRPEVSLITNIGYDHTEILGNELSQIAAEKAGIIKEQTPVVISETQPEIAGVFRKKAEGMHAPIYFADQQDHPQYATDLLGDYQQRNIKGVLTALKLLRGFTVSQENIAKGLLKVAENTGLLGRWQILREHPRVLCDTAHNREGLELVLQQLGRQTYRELHFVLGFVKEKSLDGIWPLFPKTASYYFARPDIPRGLDADLLAASALHYGVKGKTFGSIPEALRAALQAASPEDLIFVGGSNFTVAEVL